MTPRPTQIDADTEDVHFDAKIIAESPDCALVEITGPLRCHCEVYFFDDSPTPTITLGSGDSIQLCEFDGWEFFAVYSWTRYIRAALHKP